MNRIDGRALVVWDALRRLYGDAFTRVYGQEPQAAWMEQVRNLSDFELNHGIAHLAATSKLETPCTLDELIAACRTGSKQGGGGGSGRSSSYGRYKPPASTAVADEYLAKIRALFGPKTRA